MGQVVLAGGVYKPVWGGGRALAVRPVWHRPAELLQDPAQGTFPPIFGLKVLITDLIWWVPFTLLLWDATKHRPAD